MDIDGVLNETKWTEADFEQMSWHDCTIHAMAFGNENHQLMIDIDYICKWETKPKSFLFWVAPSILIFRNVYDLNISSNSLDLTILEIKRENPRRPKNVEYIDGLEYDWIIETTLGEITFTSVGYNQLIRNKPVLIKRQNLSLQERGGISFSPLV